MYKAKFRGINKVEIQFLFTTTAINLKKIVNILDVESIKYILVIAKLSFIEFKWFIFRKINSGYSV